MSDSELGRRPGFGSQRRIATTQRRGLAAEIALDDIPEVGQFVELEISVDTDGKDTSAIDAAKQALADLAQELDLSEVERRSYLELLLAERSPRAN